MSLGSVQQLLSTLVLLITLGMLVFAIYTAYIRFSGNLSEPTDPSKHRCKNCSKEFKCRCRAIPVKLEENGQITKTHTSITNNKPQGVNGFERKTVNVGSLPIEVSNPAHNKACCSVLVQSTLERFCTYQCYRARLKQISAP